MARQTECPQGLLTEVRTHISSVNHLGTSFPHSQSANHLIPGPHTCLNAGSRRGGIYLLSNAFSDSQMEPDTQEPPVLLAGV